MNNWIKLGFTGFVLGTTTVASAIETQHMKQPEAENLQQSIDAMDFAGGSKLKDRMIKVQDADKVVVVRILLDS